MNIADLRSEMGLSLEAFAAQIGLQSRGRMSVIERENRCSLDVALKIEDLSGGRVDAADLSEDVRAARHGLIDAAAQHGASTGHCGELSGAATGQAGA
jgi:predicted transcriptional regulator